MCFVLVLCCFVVLYVLLLFWFVWFKLEDTEPPIETTGWKGFGIWRVLLRLTHPTPEGMVSYRCLALDEG